MTHGFLLGKFMPPHSGHVFLCETARRLVDRLTILVCSLAHDPIPGALRLEWMREMFPTCRVIGHDESAPQAPDEHPEFWAIWRRIVRSAHPEPIDLLFAGENYGLRLAEEVGALFVPVGARSEAGAAPSRHPISATRIRAAPWEHWADVPAAVRPFFSRTICLHGPESVGKTRLAARLAAHFETIWTPEYGRYHCQAHGTDLSVADLVLIGRTQSAMIASSLPWCEKRLFVDPDALMTAAWSEMMLGEIPPALLHERRCDLYILLEDDVPFDQDGTRIYGDPERRSRFMAISRRVLEQAGVPVVAVSGSWEKRFRQAVAAVENLPPPSFSAAERP